MLEIGLEEEDSTGKTEHLRGDVVWFPRDTAQRLMSDMSVWFAHEGLVSNIFNYHSQD